MKIIRLQLIWVVVLFVGWVPSVCAQFIFNEGTEKKLLYAQSKILEIEKGALTVDQILSNPVGYNFIPTADQIIEMRSPDYGYWIHFELIVETNKDLFILIPHYGTDIIQFYQIKNGEVIHHQKAGVNIKFSEQIIKTSKAIFPLDTQQGERVEGYLYLEGHNLPSLPYYVITYKKIIEDSHLEYLFDGFMLGLLFLIFIHHMLLYFQVRELENLFYALWVVMVIVQFSIYRGYAVRFLWPEHVIINNYVDAIFAVSAIAFVLFTIYFLKLKIKAPRLYNAGRILISIYVIMIILIIAGVADSFYASFNIGTLTLFQGIWALIAGLHSWRNGFRPAIYYLIANIFLFASIFIFFAYAFGSLSHNFLTYNIMHIGFGLEIIFFSIALSDKINIFKKEKEQAEKQKITLLEENENLIRGQKARLEDQVKERTKELLKEKDKSDNLLKNILPSEVAEELKTFGKANATQYESVTILFTDFVGFTGISQQMTPKDLVAGINDYFSGFDIIMEKYNIEKIKTIGDSYMAAGGIPVKNKTHAKDVVRAALEILEFMETYKQKEGALIFNVRIGIHTGPVVAGIVGLKKFAYDIWGNAVNIASRMESNSEENKINISQATYSLVKDQFKCTHRGAFTIKGGGSYNMYFVDEPLAE